MIIGVINHERVQGPTDLGGEFQVNSRTFLPIISDGFPGGTIIG